MRLRESGVLYATIAALILAASPSSHAQRSEGAFISCGTCGKGWPEAEYCPHPHACASGATFDAGGAASSAADPFAGLSQALVEGAFNLGAAWHENQKRKAQERDAQIAATRAQWKAERERYETQKAREREERFRGLMESVKLEDALAPKGFDGDGGGLGLKGLDPDPASGALEMKTDGDLDAIVASKGAGTACMFGINCGPRTGAPPSEPYWDTKVVDLRDLRRGAWLARATTYQAADDAVAVALGDPGFAGIRIPADAVLPDIDGTGLRAFQRTNDDYRRARDTRLTASEKFAEASRRRELADQIAASSREDLERAKKALAGTTELAKKHELFGRITADLKKEKLAYDAALAEREKAWAREQFEREMARRMVRYLGSLPAATGATTMPLRSPDDPNGTPFTDCTDSGARIAKWSKAVAEQRALVEKTTAQMNAMRGEASAWRKKGKQALWSAARSEAEGFAADLAGKAKTLRAIESGLTKAGLTPQASADLVEELGLLKTTIEKVEDARKKATELAKAASNVDRKRLEALYRDLESAEILMERLVASGELEKHGEKLAGMLGPQGALTFRAARLGLDLVEATAGEIIELENAATLSWALEGMVYSRMRYEDTLARLVDGCSKPR